MPTTHDPIADAAAKSRGWIREVERELGVDEAAAYGATRAALHALRDRLSVDDAAKIAAHLPTLLRGLFYEGWRPAHAPRRMDAEAMTARVAAELPRSIPDADRAGRAVWRVLARHLPPPLLAHVEQHVPGDVRALLAGCARARDVEELYEKAAACAAEGP